MGPVMGPPPDDSGSDVGIESRRLAATSFVAYLHRSHGGAALRRALEAFDPSRRDHAAMLAYQLPFGALEEAWLGSLRTSGERQRVRDFLGYLIPLFKPYWWRQAEVVVYMVLGSLFAVLSMPVAVAAVVGALAPDAAGQGETTGLVAGLIADLQRWLTEGDTLSHLLIFVGALVVLYAVDAFVAMRRAIVSESIAQGLLISLQERMFAHLQRLPHDFYAEANVGDLMTRLSSDLQGVSTAMTGILNTGLFLVISTATAVLAVVSLDLRLSLLVLVVAPIFVISYKVLGARLATVSYERMMRTGEASTVTQESLSAHAVIKAFGLERRTVGAYHARLLGMLSSAIRMAKISSLYDAVGDMAITLGQLIVLAYGGYLVIDGQMEVAILVAFLGILPGLLLPLSGFSDIGQMVQMASGSLRRVTELLDEPLPISDAPGAAPLVPLEREIRLDGVTFGYAADRPVLRDLDLSIPAGSHAAIVGPSGSGKSTVVNLLLRFWDPQEGRVLLDGADVREVTLASLREQIGLVFQETFIFDTTVRENIAIGRPDASDDEIVRAAEGAQLAGFVDALPSGYETVLGERGTRMSGGQRQRLAIARVLLRDPKIMILDEATSALDAQTEADILQTLEAAIRGRTTITITHRLSLAATADAVFVLDRGEIVERGTHAELIVSGGLYQRMYETQTAFAREGGSDNGVDVELLREIPLLSGLSGEELAAIGARLRPERLPGGRVVVRQDEAGDRLYLIQQGRAEVLVGGDGDERRVALLGPGDVFGEMSILSQRGRTATVRTVSPTLVYSLSREDLQRLSDLRPDIRGALAGLAAERREALEQARSLTGLGAARDAPAQEPA
jgi:ABC-type multidrug transport system fused ATPase/permease subunit